MAKRSKVSAIPTLAQMLRKETIRFAVRQQVAAAIG